MFTLEESQCLRNCNVCVVLKSHRKYANLLHSTNKYEHIELASLELSHYFCAKIIVSKEYNFLIHINHPTLAS